MATNTVLFWLWKHGGKFSWMSVNAVYLNSIAMSTFCSEIITIPFRFWLHYLSCLAGENWQGDIKTLQPHSWMSLAALRVNSHIQYLSNVSYHPLARRASHLERRASHLVKRENNELSAWFRLTRQIHRAICMYGIQCNCTYT